MFNPNEITTQVIIKKYRLLSSEDSQQKQNANKFLMGLTDQQETWITFQKMIQSGDDPNFIYLGAQLFYQKIEKDLHQFDTNFKIQLKNFIFQELNSNKHTKLFIIDKLASSAALISCSLFLNQWPLFVEDLTEFMKKSPNHLISGLKVLQRIPQQLRITNRISQGIKSKIQSKFLQKEQLISIIFSSVFQLSDQSCILTSLHAMQSWIRICYPLMKYTSLIKNVLQASLQSVQKLEICMKVISESLKQTADQNIVTLSDIDPLKQRTKYTQEQVNSLKIIIKYIIENKSNFLSYINVQPEYAEMYLQIVQQLVLSYGFLILQDIGFQILSIILQLTRCQDLKLSYKTFEFWIDWSQKVGKYFNSTSINGNNTTSKIPQPIKQKIWAIYNQLLQTLINKLTISNDNLMMQADLKDDQTIDDADGMTFAQYRKQSSNMLKYIYDFFIKAKQQLGSQIYFKKVVQLLQNDNPPLTRSTQLALYLLKSPLQSMINQYQTTHLISILQFLITKINQHNITQYSIPPIVLGQTMNFIRDCTREIKQKDLLFLEALKFVLNYINDQKLCHHAAYCFQILMETINTLNDPSIAENLIQFYSEKKFTKQVVLQKILQGIFNAIIKVPDTNKVQTYLNSILSTLFNHFTSCSRNLSQSQFQSDIYLSLVEIKTILDSYDSSNSTFKSLYKTKFIQLANKSIQIVNQILPLGIKNKLRFSSINEVGLSISIYRVCLKILQFPQNFEMINYNNQPMPSFILSLSIVFMILNEKDIGQYYYTLTLFSETLVQFINHSNQYLNQWLNQNLHQFCSFFSTYYQHIQKVDPDVIKTYFTVHQSLILYNRQVFNQFKDKQIVLRMAIHALRHMNQRNMQRKAISFIYLSLQNQIFTPGLLTPINNDKVLFQFMLENIFSSIPIIHSICYTNLSKVFKYMFKQVTLQIQQNIFLTLLQHNPYHELDQNIRQLIAKALAYAILTQQQRHIKSIFIQLSQLIFKKTSSDILMQLQLKIATCKRQYNSLLKKRQSLQQQQLK